VTQPVPDLTQLYPDGTGDSYDSHWDIERCALPGCEHEVRTRSKLHRWDGAISTDHGDFCCREHYEHYIAEYRPEELEDE
jgi:hypothetical protein